jgi:asparagine synthase (glutamine-hydrolysing)
MLESVKSAIYYFEAPLGGVGTLSAYQLMQLVRDVGIKVLLSGEGADETFGGYKYYYYAYFRDLYEGGEISVLQRELDAFLRTNGDDLKIGSADFRKLVLNETASVRAPDGTSLGGEGFLGPLLLERETEIERERIGAEKLQQGGHLRRVMFDDLTRLKLPKLLWFQDRASMAWGIETRVPFLDHRLVEYVYRLSPRWIIRNGVSKYLAKRLLRRFNGLDSVSGVKHYVATPQREWLKGPLYDTMNRYLDEGYLAKSGLIDYKGWKRAYAEYACSPTLGNSFFVWKMINLEGLLQQFLGGKV